jgi:hypothetical protein
LLIASIFPRLLIFETAVRAFTDRLEMPGVLASLTASPGVPFSSLLVSCLVAVSIFFPLAFVFLTLVFSFLAFSFSLTFVFSFLAFSFSLAFNAFAFSLALAFSAIFLSFFFLFFFFFIIFFIFFKYILL